MARQCAEYVGIGSSLGRNLSFAPFMSRTGRTALVGRLNTRNGRLNMAGRLENRKALDGDFYVGQTLSPNGGDVFL